ncbi:hypothetical protein [Egbenema bharatensis]|uniref:hypothetical protein n=1 Tax=Egbenema bharatensis TaxID=3463334 RepID=UPI003A857905
MPQMLRPYPSNHHSWIRGIIDSSIQCPERSVYLVDWAGKMPTPQEFGWLGGQDAHPTGI